MIYDHVILVLKGVSLSVPRGGIVALLGANGAGKTTTLKAISNLLHAERGEVTKGSIVFEGERVDKLSPNELVRRGCIQVMEGRHCFGHLTIEENLLTGAFTRRDGNAAIKRDLEVIYDYFPRLRQRGARMAGYTSGGEQQMCAIGRAMMSRPTQLARWLRAGNREPFSLNGVIVRDYLDCGLRRVVGSYVRSIADPFRDALPRVRARTLVVRGARDPIVTQAWAEEVTRLLPRAELRVVPGAGARHELRRPRRLCAGGHALFERGDRR